MKHSLLAVLTALCLTGYTQYEFVDNLSDIETSDSLLSIYDLNSSLVGKVMFVVDTTTNLGWMKEDGLCFVDRIKFSMNTILSDHNGSKILLIEEMYGTKWKFKITVQFNSFFEGIGYIYISKFGGIILYQFPKYDNYYFTTVVYNQ